MKSLSINFTRKNRRQRPIRVALICFALLAAGSIGSLLRQDLHPDEDATLEVYRRAAHDAAASSPPASVDTDSVASSPKRRARIDVAGVFSAVESLREAGVRLSSLVLDVHEQTARVDIELHSIDQVARCVQQLQLAQPSAGWALVSVQSHQPGRSLLLVVEARGTAW